MLHGWISTDPRFRSCLRYFCIDDVLEVAVGLMAQLFTFSWWNGEERLSLWPITFLIEMSYLQRSHLVSLSDECIWSLSERTWWSLKPVCSIPIERSFRPTVCRQRMLSGTNCWIRPLPSTAKWAQMLGSSPNSTSGWSVLKMLKISAEGGGHRVVLDDHLRLGQPPLASCRSGASSRRPSRACVSCRKGCGAG